MMIPVPQFKLNFPQKITDKLGGLFNRLNPQPFHTLFVGGFVRDALLGKESIDIDYATLLSSEAVIHILHSAGLNPMLTGINHGSVRTEFEGFHIDITHLRKDRNTDGRHADIVYTESWREDAQRRDFTMNALYADLEGNLYDPLGLGKLDALAGRIRFIGDPHQRIQEDYLRILRYFRFQAWYGKQPPDALCMEACAAQVSNIHKLSRERITQEFLHFLRASTPSQAVGFAINCGVMQEILSLPSQNIDLLALKRLELLEHKVAQTLEITYTPNSFVRGFSLFPTYLWEQVPDIFSTLRLSKEEKKYTQTLAQILIQLQTNPFNPSPSRDGNMRAYIHQYSKALCVDAALLFWIHNPQMQPILWESFIKDILHTDVASFPFTAKDIEDLGISAQGKTIGLILQNVHMWWLQNNCLPSLEECREFAIRNNL